MTGIESIDKRRTTFFSRIALRHKLAIKLLAKAKITRRDQNKKKLSREDRGNWGNLIEHHLSQIVVAEVLADALGLSKDEKLKLTIVASIHDYDKRIEKQPELFSAADREAIHLLLERINPDATLLGATKVDFLIRHLVERRSTFLECVQSFIDDTHESGNIVSVWDRYPALKKRWAATAVDPTWQATLEPVLGQGTGYWEGQAAKAADCEKQIFERLQARGVYLENARDIPAWIRKQIEKKYA